MVRLQTLITVFLLLIIWELYPLCLCRPTPLFASSHPVSATTRKWPCASIVVFPFQNASGGSEINWLSMAMQETLTTDLMYVSHFNAKPLLDYNGPIKNSLTQRIQLCEPGAAQVLADKLSAFTLDEWVDIATRGNADLLIWGRYRQQSDAVQVVLQLYNVQSRQLLCEIKMQSNVSLMKQELSQGLLKLIRCLSIDIKDDEKQRILYQNKVSDEAWRNYAEGKLLEQQYFACNAEVKKSVAKNWEDKNRRALAIDPEYADALCGLGSLRLAQGDLDGAIEFFEKALALRSDMVQARFRLGYCFLKKGLPQKAAGFFEQAVALNPSLSSYHVYLVQAFRSARLWKRGLNAINSLVDFYRQQGCKSEQIESMWWQAEFLQEAGRFAEAETVYVEVLRYKKASLGDQHSEVATIMNSLARLYYTVGDYDRAKLLYQKVLVCDENNYGKEHPNTAGSLSNLAGILFAQGQYNEAKTLYDRALAIYIKSGSAENPDVAKCLNNLAEVYRALGDITQSEYMQQDALKRFTSVYGNSHPETAACMSNLAELYKTMGKYTKAAQFLEQALASISAANGQDSPETARILNSLAGIYFLMGDLENAKALYERALKIDRAIYGPLHPKNAIRLNNLAEIYYAKNDYQKAQELYNQALTIALMSTQPDLLWKIQANLSYLLSKTGSHDAAILFGKESVNTIQAMRSNISGMEKELRESFLNERRHIYCFLADLLIERGRVPEAQQIISMQKEEEFFNFIRRDSTLADVRTTTAGYSAAERQWAERYRDINDRVAALGVEYAGLVNKELSGHVSQEESGRLEKLEEDLKTAQKHFNAYLENLITSFDSFADPRRQRELGEKNLKSLAALQGTLRDLGGNAVIVHYLVTPHSLRIILTTADIQLAREAKISAKALNQKILAFRQALQSPRLDPRPAGRELYRVIIGPIENDLKQAKAETLMLSLDGALRYLPVAALYDGSAFVAERYRTVMYTEAARDKIKDHPQANWQVAGLGMRKGVPKYNLSPLPTVLEELEGIVKKDASDRDGVFSGVVFIDNDFSYKSLSRILRRKYPVLHIASHFVFKPGDALNSYLVLGDSTTLTVSQIKDELNFNSIDLITLSACDTAMGETGAGGEEIEGIGTLAQRKGAKSVLATLWPVADISCGLFMQILYSMRHERNLTMAEAIREAQLYFIKGAASAETSSASARGIKIKMSEASIKKQQGIPYNLNLNAPFSHPYFWAPFILMGNWL